MHTPELLISLPKRARLVVDGEEIRAKTPSMAASTSPDGITAPLAYEPTGFAKSLEDIFKPAASSGADVAGRIVVCEGQPMGGKTGDLQRRGAVGVIFVSPGERIHEGIVTTIWGSPDTTSWERKARIPVISIGRGDGQRLIERIQGGDALEATLVAEHDEGFRPIPVVVAEIRGNVEPERFVLVHGHIDSWHVGVGDNATGDATLLEVARVLSEHRARMARSVRVCWWSGHSHGRYAGSTWYAEAFANDIARNCIAHVNCDSPGCRDANAYEAMMWMAEAEDVAKACVTDFIGFAAAGGPPVRGGDISFNNLGVSSFFMLTSHMSREEIARRGWYGVGGCGGNLEWHHEDDTLEIADRDVLLRDMKLYVGAAFRVANSPLHPLDFRATLRQIEATLSGYEEQVGGLVDLTPTHELLREVTQELDAFYAEAAAAVAVEAARPFNDAQLKAGRALVRVLYARDGAYRQDVADHIPLLPELGAAAALRGAVPDGVLRTDLARARNRIEGSLLDVRDAVQAARRGA